MSEKLSHLSNDEILELIERYYSKEKVSNLISDYKLDLRPSQLVRHLPPEVLDTKCTYCEVNLIKPRLPRDYQSWKMVLEYCPSCGHEEGGFCSCKNCKAIEWYHQDRERQEKQDFLDIWLNHEDEEKIELEDLTFTEKVYLGALLREGISEDYNYIKPIESFISPLTPTYEFRSEIINTLSDIGSIVIHHSTDSEFIEIVDYEEGNYRYYPYKVKWALNIRSRELNKVPLVESIINPSEIQETDYDEAFLLWKKIALYESIEYFEHSVNNILGIDYNIGEKTRTVLNDLTNDFSVSQIYGILYRSTNNALRFQAERGVSMKHASNTIVGNAQSFAERARINKWELQKYNRIKNLPQSALSRFFFERIIKIGFDGFNEIPDLSRIRN
ncbi:hypothetical protein [Ulvibacterium sp.]|uniref:hypothetical protein n=1 Tax=Ulvibacterium sp. TaxID=2665914 RepID=UPI003BA97B21